MLKMLVYTNTVMGVSVDITSIIDYVESFHLYLCGIKNVNW